MAEFGELFQELSFTLPFRGPRKHRLRSLALLDRYVRLIWGFLIWELT